MKFRKSLMMVLALLAVFMLAASCGSNDSDDKNPAAPPAVPVVLGPAELSGPVTATLTFEINKDILPLVSSLLGNRIENLQEVLTAAATIADNASLEAVWDGPSVQVNALLKNQPIAYAAVRADGDRIIAVSDVMPGNSALQATMNDLGYYGDKPLDLNFSPADLGLLEDTVKDMYRKIDGEIAVKTDSAETGSWTFEGTTFTSRRRVTATTREIAVIAVKTFRDALRDPKITALLAKVSVNPDSLYLDDRIRYMEEETDDYYPTLEAYRYTNGNGDTLTVGTITTYINHYSYDWETGSETYTREPGSVLNVQYGTIGQDFSLKITQAGADDAIVLTADRRGYNYNLIVNISNVYRAGGMSISGRVEMSGKTAQNGEREGSILVQAMSMDIITLKYTIRQGGKVTASFDTTGKQVYPLYHAVTDAKFLRSLKLTDIAGKVTAIMPEEAAKIAPLARQLLSR